MTNIFHLKPYKKVPSRNIFCLIILLYIFLWKINFHIRKHTSFFCRIHSLQLHQSSSVGTKTIFFNKKRNENTIQQTYQVFTIHTIENIIRKGKRDLSLYSVRLIEDTYLKNFVFLNHNLKFL
mgnify:CR=1 FL=1